MRLNLVRYSVDVVNNSRNISDVRVIENSKNNLDTTYFELSHNVGKKRIPIKVILRKIGKGQIHYYSIKYGRKKNRL